MEENQSILSKVIPKIKSRRGGLYLILGGVLITVLSCASTFLLLSLSPSPEKGPTGSSVVAIFGLLSLSMIGIGVVITIIGGIISLLQNQKAKKLNAETTSSTVTSDNLNQIEPESNWIQTLPFQSSLPEEKSNDSMPLEPLPIQPLSIQPVSVIRPVQAVFAQPAPNRGLPIEKRREILQREINKYLRQGYRVISQTDTTAQLVKPKVFSCLWFLINMILLIGWIFYLLWYWSKRDTQVYIEVDINGRVKIRK